MPRKPSPLRLAALQSGEDWKNYLAFQAKLHAYRTT
jgi:hypothetical protein